MTEDLRDWIDQQDYVMGAFQRCVHGYRALAENRPRGMGILSRVPLTFAS